MHHSPLYIYNNENKLIVNIDSLIKSSFTFIQFFLINCDDYFETFLKKHILIFSTKENNYHTKQN